MSVGHLFGFDEIFQSIFQTHPEVTLHVARTDNKMIATVKSSDIVAIATGSAGDSPGPIIRQVLSDLRARLLVRDAAINTAAATAAALSQVANRRREIQDEISDLSYDIDALLEELNNCDTNRIPSLAEQLHRLRSREDELLQEELRLNSGSSN